MADSYPIKLAATPEAWRLFSVRKSDQSFQKFKQQVFERDDYTCCYCGFQAKKYQEIVNLDNDYRNNKLPNLVTACCFCSQCFFLEAVGNDDYGGGILIYLPEISQADLNGFCHVLFCAMSNDTSYSSIAQNIYRDLKLRSKIVEQHLGEGMSEATLFGRMLIDVTGKDKEKVDKEILSSLRLLPSYSKFGKQVKDWSEAMQEDVTK
jgi:intracellular multiplication protein IcmJ